MSATCGRCLAMHLADLAVIDVSFIGLELVLPVVARFLQPSGQVVALIKPQFEAGRGQVGKGGVVKDATVHRQVLERVLGRAASNGWSVHWADPLAYHRPQGQR